jgi:hypothetical protein
LKKNATAVREKLLIRLASPPIDLAIKVLATDGRATSFKTQGRAAKR